MIFDTDSVFSKIFLKYLFYFFDCIHKKENPPPKQKYKLNTIFWLIFFFFSFLMFIVYIQKLLFLKEKKTGKKIKQQNFN